MDVLKVVGKDDSLVALKAVSMKNWMQQSMVEMIDVSKE
jgi:hypothetical protein